jgi:hypothetical protein
MEEMARKMRLILEARIAADGLSADTKINQLPEYGGAAPGTEPPIEVIDALPQEAQELVPAMSSARNGYSVYTQYRMHQARAAGEYKGQPQALLSEIAKEWRGFSSDEQKPWNDQAALIRAGHGSDFDGLAQSERKK